MSLINQVLQDLEKRGVPRDGADPLASQVRVVPRRPARAHLRWGVALLVLAAAFGLTWNRLREGVPQTAAPLPAEPAEPAKPIEPPAAAPVNRQEQTKVMSAPVVESAEPPASRLSFELGSVPLPPAPRRKISSPPTVPAKSVAAVQVEKPAPLPSVPENKPRPQDKPAAAAEAGKMPSAATGGLNASAPKTVQSLAVPQSTDVSIDKHVRQLSSQQRAENEFRKAVGLMQQGRIDEALESYGAALQIDPGHEAARQAMVGLLLENKRIGEAERALREGLDINPKQTGFAMALARIRLDKGDTLAALDTLQKGLPYAANEADYHAFMAALLQKLSRHREAIEHYQTAVRLAPQSGVWLMGLGISLQAEGRLAEAQEAFKRAKASNSLNPELLAFVDQRLRQIQQQLKQ